MATFAFWAASGLAIPGEPDDALTYFGSRPIYNNGAKANVVVDDFGWLDDYRVAGIEGQLSSTIEEWEANGIGYAAYFALGAVESDEAIAAMGDAGRVMDLDGTPGSYFMWTRQVFVDYLIDAGKTAVDLGAVYFLIDNGAPGLPTLSFDAEIVESFRQYLASNYTTGELAAMGVGDVSTFNYRSYLMSADGGNYTDSASVRDNPPGDALWEAWIANLEREERAFFVEWTTTLKAYAQTTYSRDIYLSANRGHSKAWSTADVFDFTMSETFLDTLGYPHHNLDDHFKTSLSFGKRFWSWNFPANTGSLNGSNEPYGTLKITELSKLFAAETLASGGLYQIPIDWISYTREDERLNDLLGPTLRFPRLHPGLFNLNRAGEVVVLYNEAYDVADASAYRSHFQGILALLGESQWTYDVVVAGAPNRRGGSDPLLTADLSGYEAVILSKTRMLSDAQIAKLVDYANNGGRLIGLGAVGDLDEHGADASGSRSFDDYFGSDASATVGSGAAIGIATEYGDLYHGKLGGENVETDLSSYRSAFASATTGHVEPDLQVSLGRKVRAHRYALAAGSEVYHIVNRDINLTADVTQQSFNATTAASASVELPNGYDESTVTLSWVSVESPVPTVLSFTRSGDYLNFTLPAFEHWGVLTVGAPTPSPATVDETPEANIDLFAAAGGHRPDKLDSEGDLAFPYWYWRGGNHEAAPWAVPFLASDDIGLASVKLFYRYSSDNVSWGAWSEHSTVSVSGQNASGSFSFEGPDGEGYYQFRVQAVDTSGQEEVVIARDEAGYGFDETAPGEPSNAAAAGFTSGAWIEDLTGFTVTWDLPSDNLSGLSAAHIMLSTASQTLVEESISAATQSWSPDTSGLVAGERHAVQYRVEDASGNWNSYAELFSFYYGSLPVADLENVSVAAGDARLIVSWTIPDDANYSHAAFAYRPAGEGEGAWLSGGQSPDSQATQHEITGLTNGVAYEVRVNSVATDGSAGNLVLVAGSYTPQQGAGGGGPETVAAPTGLALEDNGQNVRLTWIDNADNETGYAIERRVQGETSWTAVATIGENAQAFVNNINIGSTTYEYRVKAVGASVDSEYSSVQSISRDGGGGNEPAPAAPSALSATDDGSKVQLNWTDNSGNETGFAIERRLLGEQSWSQLTTVGANATGFQDMTDIGSSTYEYRVKAIGNGVQSPYSNVATVSRESGGGEEPAPAAPSGVTAEDLGDRVRIAWTDNSSDETGFAVVRREQGTQTWLAVGTAAANATQLEDLIDIGSKSYEYRVSAEKGAVASAFSDVATVSRESGGGEEPAPAAPSGVTAEDLGDRVRIAWTDNSSDETGFAVVRREQGTQTWLAVGTAAANATQLEDLIDIGSTSYEYRVSAEKGAVASAFSDVATVSRGSGGGQGAALTVIPTGFAPETITGDETTTIGSLRSLIAGELSVEAGDLRLYLGDFELTQDGQSLPEAGFLEGDQFTAIVDGDLTSYAAWQLSFFGTARAGRLPSEDLNGDGVGNFVCYALGIDPVEDYRGVGMARIQREGSSWTVEHSLNEEASEAMVELWVSVDGGASWQSAESYGFTREADASALPAATLVRWSLATLVDTELLVELRVSRK